MHQTVADLKKLSQQLLQFIHAPKNQDIALVIRVESAVPLTSGQKGKLTQILSKKLKNNLSLENQVDPSLIAGLRIKYKDQLIDASIKAKLDYLKESLLND